MSVPVGVKDMTDKHGHHVIFAETLMRHRNSSKVSAIEQRDEAIIDTIENESVSLSHSRQRQVFLKAVLEKLKVLESLLMDIDVKVKNDEIIQLIDELEAHDIADYRTDEVAATFLHLVVNRPNSSSKLEPVLLQVFDKLLEKECDLNMADSYGWTPLTLCCNFNYMQIAAHILEHARFNSNATLDLKSQKQFKSGTLYFLIGTTPLQVCCWRDHLKLGKLLIKHGANIHAKNEAGWTALHICARQAHLDFLNYLIRKEAHVNVGNDHQKTPLHVSARHGHVQVTQALLKANANVALRNNYGQSPLFVAVIRGHTEVIRLLLQYNADPNQTDNQNNNPLHACAMLEEVIPEPNEQENVVIEQRIEEEPELEESSSKGDRRTFSNLKAPPSVKKPPVITTQRSNVPKNVEIAELLLQRGCDPCMQNSLGSTPLHNCAKNDCSALAALFIAQSSAIINARDAYGETPLFAACKWRSARCQRLLLSRAANKDIPDSSGTSPIHFCAAESNENMLATLLEFGDDVNKALAENNKDTPLHLVAKNNNATMVAFLLRSDCDVNKANAQKQTPLHVACANGADKTCALLLNGGAKVNKTDQTGQTPLHSSIFAPYNSMKVARMLVDYGSSINQEDEQNQNSLALATIHGNFEIVSYLVGKKAKIMNSKYESVAHLCSQNDLCNTECMRLLIDKYGFDSLFSYSLTYYRTPLQLSVECKSYRFLEALIACDNITCLNWFSMLHSIDGLGISPLVMAVSSQNYTFLASLVVLWYRYFHDTHHEYQQIEEDEKEEEYKLTLSRKLTSFWQQKFKELKKTLIPRALMKQRQVENLYEPTKKTHGCAHCFDNQYCLFKPNWNDPSHENEKYFLNILIRDNVSMTLEILNTFMKTDILKDQTYIYLDHVEPCEDIMGAEVDGVKSVDKTYERPLTPLETCLLHRKLDLMNHPVIKTLITAKYNDYGKLPFWFETIRNILLLIVWTVFAVLENYSIRHFYRGSNMSGKIVLIIFVILLFLWDTVEEVRQIYYLYRRLSGYKTWIRKKYAALKAVEKDFDRSRQKIEEVALANQQLSNREANRSRSVINKNLRMNKFSLIEREAKAAESLPNPYNRVENWIDWVAILLEIIALITHFVDIGAHNDERARLHLCFVYTCVIVLWLRQLLLVNGFFPGINLVCMLRLLGSYILQFAFLYARVYIPFLLLFWAMYVGSQVPQRVMRTNWRECETIQFGLPYEGTFAAGVTLANFTQTCEATVNVQGFATFYESLFAVFMIILIQDIDFEHMQEVQYEFAPILLATAMILLAIIGLNFFIGLMSNVLSEGAYKSVEAHKSIEILGFMLQHEWRLSKARRQEHMNKIKYEYSPKILEGLEAVVSSASAKNTVKSSSSSDTGSGRQKNDAARSLAPDERHHADLAEDLKKFAQDINDLKSEFSELKALLMSNMSNNQPVLSHRSTTA